MFGNLQTKLQTSGLRAYVPPRGLTPAVNVMLICRRRAAADEVLHRISTNAGQTLQRPKPGGRWRSMRTSASEEEEKTGIVRNEATDLISLL